MFHLCNISQALNDFLYADLQPSFIDEPLASLTGFTVRKRFKNWKGVFLLGDVIDTIISHNLDDSKVRRCIHTIANKSKIHGKNDSNII
jgi:hypothetical protein